MFSRLKRLLAECHILKGDNGYKAALSANPSYCLSRAREALDEIENISTSLVLNPEKLQDKEAIRIIRLMTILRYHLDAKSSDQTE